MVQQEFMSQGNSKEALTSRVRSKAVVVRMNLKEVLSAKKKCQGGSHELRRFEGI